MNFRPFQRAANGCLRRESRGGQPLRYVILSPFFLALKIFLSVFNDQVMA